MIPACRAIPYTASALAYSGRGLWFGFSVLNAHATESTVVTFYDGVGTGGVKIGFAEVPGVSSATEFPNGAAVATEQGLYVGIAGGTATVVPYYLTQTRLTDALALYDHEVQGVGPMGLLHLLTWLQEHGYDLPDLTDVSPG